MQVTWSDDAEGFLSFTLRAESAEDAAALVRFFPQLRGREFVLHSWGQEYNFTHIPFLSFGTDACEDEKAPLGVYCVKLANALKFEHVPGLHRETSWLYVAASSFHNAHEAVMDRHPGAEIRSIDLLNYKGVPIIIGR